MSDDKSQRPNQGETVAMVLRHLCWVPPGTVLPDAKQERVLAQRIAMDWQQLGVRAESAEIHGARNGTPEGRMSELMGRAAVNGEQLGLAWTLDQELQRLQATGSDEHHGRTMATRALAETCGYYLLGAGHGLGNLTLRTLILSKAAAVVLGDSYPKAKGFPPFSETREAWPPLNNTLADRAVKAAATTGESSASTFSQILRDLVADRRWIALVQRRDTDYHRWRPQGLPSGGVPRRSLWDESTPDRRSLSWGGAFYEPVDHEELCQTAGEALEALSGAMEAWLNLWPAALQAVGVPVFKDS